ncbi:MAG: hypothetical protein U0271_46195 [Polyangiaceae bacterium]
MAPASSAPLDAQDFCTRLCDRSASCGLEAAQALADRSHDKADVAAVDEAKKDQANATKACVTQCLASPPKTTAEAQPEMACMDKRDCKSFRECLHAGLVTKP